MKFINGITTHGRFDVDLLKAAGFGWVRAGFPYPFANPDDGTLTPEYRRAAQHARLWAEAGFRLIGGTPGIGVGTYVTDSTGNLRLEFTPRFPAWMGVPGSEDFYRHYQRACAFLARDLGALAPLWQIGNELDWEQFAGPLNLRQAAELVLRAAIAIKETNPDLLVGTNCAGAPTTYYFLGRLFDDPRIRPDYCGIDQYYGTWQPGGPESWARRIDELYDLTGGVPVFVNEWGYASRGELMTAEERQRGAPCCQLKKWAHGWDAGHTPAVQAEFIRRTLAIFREKREKMLGQCFFRWEDTATCWQCGAADCPVETAWGLVTVDGTPKEAYGVWRAGQP